jgi:hypothetical protein
MRVLQAIVNEVNAAAHQAKAKLEAIDKLNTAAQQKKGQGVGSASERTRTSITSGAAAVGGRGACTCTRLWAALPRVLAPAPHTMALPAAQA